MGHHGFPFAFVYDAVGVDLPRFGVSSSLIIFNLRLELIHFTQCSLYLVIEHWDWYNWQFHRYIRLLTILFFICRLLF